MYSHGQGKDCLASTYQNNRGKTVTVKECQEIKNVFLCSGKPWQEWQQWLQWQVVLTVQYFPASGSFTGQRPSKPSLQWNFFHQELCHWVKVFLNIHFTVPTPKTFKYDFPGQWHNLIYVLGGKWCRTAAMANKRNSSLFGPHWNTRYQKVFY